MSNLKQTKPKEVIVLETAYGPPSQNGFGSAVFYEQRAGEGDLEVQALEKYQYFVGELWERYGEDAWLNVWKQVYERQPAAIRDIVAELRAINDPDASLSVQMILDGIQDAQTAREALSAVYDNPSVSELRVYNLGDGGAMSGILVAGKHANGDATFLVFLLD